MDITKFTSRIKHKTLPEDFNHPESKNYQSNWEYTKTLSSYHFDPFVVEHEGDYVEFIGKYKGNWSSELKSLIDKSKEMTWTDLSNQQKHPGFKTGVSVTIEQERFDKKLRGLENNDYTQLVLHDYVMSMPSFKKMVDFWELENVAVRGQVQMPGQSYIMHVDKLWHRNPKDPSKIIRFVINLADYEQGQLVQYGNFNVMQWRAGDIHIFDTLNVPHCTSNMSDKPRPSLVITGLRTQHTDNKLAIANKHSQYKI